MARNLLGRLNGRSGDDLTRIARFWRVPGGSTPGPKHRLVGALYRTMTDVRGGRDAWDRLDDREQSLVTLLSQSGDAAMAVADIARRLGESEATTHEIAARLYRVGIVARESDDDPLPIGAVPRLFLPIEIGQLFRRVRDERELGDLSSRPLPTLLTLMDDPELEEAAGYWGFRSIPGLYRRDDLIARITAGVSDPDRRATVVRGLTNRREATRLWDAVLTPRSPEDVPTPAADEATNGSRNPTVPLADAIAAAGLDADPDDAAAQLKLRATLSDLESRLLLWHTYDADGGRHLFVPAEIRDPGAAPVTDLAPLDPVPDDATPSPDALPWRSPDALAWDLLTLARALGSADAPAVSTVDALPRPWLRWLNSRLWWHGTDTPPAGYLAFLVELGRAEGVLGTVDGPHGPALGPTAAIRAWRDRSFPDQTAALKNRWLTTDGWPEGAARSDLTVQGADWRGFRRRLTGHLGRLAAPADSTTSPTARADGRNGKDQNDQGPWYPIDELAEWIAAADPDILGDTFAAAQAGYSGPTEPDRRRAAIAAAITTALTTALTWFHDVETAPGARDRPMVRVRAAAPADHQRRPAGAAPPGKPSTGPRAGNEPALTIDPDGTVRLRHPSPVRVWSLLLFADPVALGEISTWRLSEAALGRALAAGFEPAQVTEFLTRQSRRTLPEPVTADLGDWANRFRRVRLGPAVTLRPDDPAQAEELVSVARSAGLSAHPLPGKEGLVVVSLPGPVSGTGDALDQLRERLRTAGFHPS
ncbi:MAG TPA: helicase-associated domain-containing protein [Thermomicrobiales bacterium]|jgi:hypothetical protein|nr:helicase-associated domain-containing protein [Thermomicrobiales bacterium]